MAVLDAGGASCPRCTLAGEAEGQREDAQARVVPSETCAAAFGKRRLSDSALRWVTGGCFVAQPACGGGLLGLVGCRDWCRPRESSRKRRRVCFGHLFIYVCDMWFVSCVYIVHVLQVVHIVLSSHACPVCNLYLHEGNYAEPFACTLFLIGLLRRAFRLRLFRTPGHVSVDERLRTFIAGGSTQRPPGSPGSLHWHLLPPAINVRERSTTLTWPGVRNKRRRKALRNKPIKNKVQAKGSA